MKEVGNLNTENNKIENLSSTNDVKGKNRKNEREEIWKMAEEIEEILDRESGHPLAGILSPEHPRWKKLLAEALSDEITPERIKEILEEIITAAENIKRGRVSFSFKIYTKDPEKRKRIEQELNDGANHILQRLKISESSPESFLGNGSTSEVFIVISSEEKLCVKIIKNSESYNALDSNGKRVHRFLDKEGDILDQLEDFVVKDVKTPAPYYYISAPQLEGLIMETLDAANLTRVFEGHEEMPENFDVDEYFEKLEKYFQTLHNKMGIIHGDVAIRNLMVDKKTGLPRVIDFGKAKTKQELWGTGKDFDELAKNEMELLKNVKQEVREKYNNFIKKQ